MSEAIRCFEEAQPGSSVGLEANFNSGNANVQGNPEKLRQVLINQLTNAIDASPEGGHVALTTTRLPDNSHVRIEVSNTSVHDIADPKLLLEPFRSTKPHGTGLGLAIVNGIVSAMSGNFALEQREHRKVVASVNLPIA